MVRHAQSNNLDRWLGVPAVPRPRGTNYIPSGGPHREVYFYAGYGGADCENFESLAEPDRDWHLNQVRGALEFLRKKKPEKVFITKVKSRYHNAQRTHNRFGRIKRFINLIYVSYGSMERRPEWQERSLRSAILACYKIAGLSSFGAAKQIDERYRKGILFDPFKDQRPKRPVILDRIRDYLMQNLRRWKPLSLPERTEVINLRFACPIHEVKHFSCTRCENERIHISVFCLRNWYLRNNIKYRMPPYRIAGSQT
jgi:hypothetical protein